MTRHVKQRRLAVPLSACAFAAAYAVTEACFTLPDPPPIQSGRYVLTASAGAPLPAIFTDSAGRLQRVFGDTIDLTVATSTYIEHGTVGLILADGSVQAPQSFVIGPRTYRPTDNTSIDLPSTIVGTAHVTNFGSSSNSQIQLTKPGLFWLYTLR